MGRKLILTRLRLVNWIMHFLVAHLINTVDGKTFLVSDLYKEKSIIFVIDKRLEFSFSAEIFQGSVCFFLDLWKRKNLPLYTEVFLQ